MFSVLADTQSIITKDHRKLFRFRMISVLADTSSNITGDNRKEFRLRMVSILANTSSIIIGEQKLIPLSNGFCLSRYIIYYN